jgi:hypothetical protein
MKYALGNMLNGAGGLNADGLSLDLQFAADKTLTARKGPTPVFIRASTATFVGSDGLIQSAAVNAARFDHDPVTLACKGLLIEEARTNLLARSEELGNAYWTISNASISENNQTSPNGSLTADTITVSAGTPSLYRAVACTASTLYTFSFYIKIGTLTPSDFKFAVRDDTNGVFIAENIVPNITPVTTGWRRVTYTFTTPVGCVLVRPYLMRYSYLSAGTIYLWGAQLEAGSFATSYIPTVASSVVRSADLCSITGADFSGFYNQSEGTLFANIQSTGTGDRRPVAFDIGNNSQAYWFYSSTTLNRYAQANGPLGSFNINGTIPSAPLRYAGTIKDGDYSLALNGSIVGSSSATLGRTDTAMRIGCGAGGGAQLLCGHISSVRYFKKRLPNAKLQAITA